MKYLRYLPAALLGLFYLCHISSFVQGGDSAELVSAAYNRFVAHPPGYPAWLWLQYLFTHLFAMGSVFSRASVLNVGFAVLALSILPQGRVATLVALILGLSIPFAEAAILPDVFALHALLVVSIGILYFSDSPKRWPLLFFCFGIGAAHHLTIIFLFPLLIDFFIDARSDRKLLKSGLLSGILAATGALFLYLSLMFFQPESPYSWGNLSSLSSVLNHVLRTDYGTWQLASQNQWQGVPTILFFLRSTWLELAALFILILFGLIKEPFVFRQRRVLVWTIASIFSLAFLAASNVAPHAMGSEILIRFQVMPLVMLSILALQVCRSIDRAPLVLVSLLILFSAYRTVQHVSGSSSDSVFEDYATNLLQDASLHKPVVILADNDNIYFDLRYLQAMQNKHEDVAVISPRLLFNKWYLEKLNKTTPALSIPSKDDILRTRVMEIETDLISPNIANLSFVVRSGYQDGKTYHATFMSLARVLSPGTGIAFAYETSPLLRTNLNAPPKGPQAYSKGLQYSEYAFYYMAKGRFEFQLGDREKALKNMARAYDLVPYAFPALANLCQMDPKDLRCSEGNLTKVREQSSEYF
jgi:hypothetical protein